jgi:hypothetical protein
MNIVVSTLAFALGLFVASSPARAAQIWSSERLGKMTPQARVWYLRGYRMLGVLMSVAGLLFAFDTIHYGY